MFYYVFFIILLAGAAACAWGISRADFRRRIIPDAYLFPLLLIGLVVTQFFPWPVTPSDGAIAAVAGYTLTSLIGLIFEKIHPSQTPPIGMGDIKLISVAGIWLGSVGLAGALALACILGMIWGATKKQKYIPFGPFLIIGGILSLITITFLI